MESFAAAVLDGLSSGTVCARRHAMPRLVVDVLLTAGKPAGCWFHHEKATPPESVLLGDKEQLARVVT